MPIRCYLSPVSGPGGAGGYRPAVTDAFSGASWSATDGRPNRTLAGGMLFVQADVTPAQHTAGIAVAGVVYLPIEAADGTPVPPSDPISTIPLAKRDQITATCDTHHIPLGGLKLADPVRFLLRRIRLRYVLRQVLADIDLTEGLETLVSAMTALRRQAINTRLMERGFNSRDAGVLGTDTIRAGIMKMVLEREETDRGD